MKPAEMLYRLQVQYAAWVFKRVALNIGCDFDSMANIIKDELKEVKWD